MAAAPELIRAPQPSRLLKKGVDGGELLVTQRQAKFFDAVWNLWNWDDVTDRFNRGRGKEAKQKAPVGRAN